MLNRIREFLLILTVLTGNEFLGLTYLCAQNGEPRLFSKTKGALSRGDQSPGMSGGPRSTQIMGGGDSAWQISELSKENMRLRRLLQGMELDRLRAVHNQLPREEAFALREAIWVSPVIPVSWENPEAASDEERQWVRDAVKETWEVASGLKFTGWGEARGNSRGIRIRINDEGPHCKRLGSKLDGYPDGMVLNFTFQNWCPACLGISNENRKYSIKAIAAHEFGHAIGFAHEQNRADAPGWCQEQRQGSDGDWYVTIYDPESIMNYCSTEWNNQGKLSDLDKQAVQLIYGLPPSQSPQGGDHEGEPISPPAPADKSTQERSKNK